MDDEIYDAISEFVEDLWGQNLDTKGATPFALYRRLVRKNDKSDDKSMGKIKLGFANFFKMYDKNIISGDLDGIPRGTNINFGSNEKFYIPIQKFIFKSDNDTKDVIRQHLLTISTLLNPEDEKISLLEECESRKVNFPKLNIDTSTKEGKFIGNLMNEVGDTMQNMEHTTDPMKAIMGLMGSGALTKFMSEINSGESKGLNPRKMLKAMNEIVEGFLPPEEENNTNTETTKVDNEGTTITTEENKVVEDIEIVKENKVIKENNE